MPRRSPVLRKYPYPNPIPPFLDFEKIPTPHPSPMAVNEYFNIEALLRTDKAMDAFLKKGIEGLRALFHENKIKNQDPLTRSHHVLLTNPPLAKPDPDVERVMEKLGYVNLDLNLRDLAIAAARPQKFKIGSSEYSYWATGRKEVHEALRKAHPRFLYLAIDVTKDPTPVKDFIGELIVHKRGQLNAFNEKHPPTDIFKDFRRYSQTPFNNISVWLKYYECYDQMIIYNLEPRKIAYFVYKKKDERFVNQVRTALTRVKADIAAAANGIWPPPRPRKTPH